MRTYLGLVAGGKPVWRSLCVGAILLLWHPPDPAMIVIALMFAAMPILSIFPAFGQRHQLERFCAGALLLAALVAFVTVQTKAVLAPALELGH